MRAEIDQMTETAQVERTDHRGRTELPEAVHAFQNSRMASSVERKRRIAAIQAKVCFQRGDPSRSASSRLAHIGYNAAFEYST